MYVSAKIPCHRQDKIQVYDRAVVHGWPIQIYAGMQLHSPGTQKAVFLRGTSNAWLDVLPARMSHRKPKSRIVI